MSTTETTTDRANARLRTHERTDHSGGACTCVFGVRGPDPRSTVVRVGSFAEATEMLMDDDVIVVSANGWAWAELS